MSQWKKIASFAALSASMALTATGCMANSADEATDEQEIAAVQSDETSPVVADQGDEQTGEANQAWFGFGGLGFRRFGFPFFGGFGGFPFFGGFGGLGLGFGGLGCGLGFGGCGLGGFGLGFGGCGLGGFGWPFWGGFGGLGCGGCF